jgi:glutamate racemase
VGGLTVLRALRAAHARENFIYLGDTARLPYGTKSAETVARYSLQCARRWSAGIRCLVVACNTASASAQACSLFVAMAEEGWVDGPIAESVARRYLEPMFCADAAPRGSPYGVPYGVPDTLVLGCTHFPALAPAIRAVLPVGVTIVDSAASVAAVVAHEAAISAEAAVSSKPAGGQVTSGGVQWLATDGAQRFARVSSVFLGSALRADDIEIIDL